MNSYERNIVEQVERIMAKSLPRGSVKRMAELGLLDLRKCEKIAITHFVERRFKQGKTKGEAMVEAAEHYNCSFEKIRYTIYTKK